MKAGSLRHRIVIQDMVPTQDAVTGEVTITPTTFATVWADKRAISAREFISASLSGSKVTIVVTIRYLAGVKPSMRIISGDDVLNIEGVLPDPKTGLEYLTLPCSEVEDG
jgi:SPP1 family predicted phage head-tail adaptor